MKTQTKNDRKVDVVLYIIGIILFAVGIIVPIYFPHSDQTARFVPFFGAGIALFEAKFKILRNIPQ